MSRVRVVPLALLWFSVVSIGCGTSDESIEALEDVRARDAEPLIAALASERPERQARAALAMGRIQDAGYAEPLAEATRSPDRQVRRTALFALGQLGLAEGATPPAAAVEACRVALAAEEPKTIAVAVEALGKLAPEGAAELFTPLLRHGDADVRVAAAHALFRLRFVPTWRRQATEPPPLPTDAVDALTLALSDPDPGVRRAVAHAFSRYGGPSSTEALVHALADEDEWVRLWSARALGRSEDPSVSGALADLLAEPSARVRGEAVDALIRLDRPSLVPGMMATDASFAVRAAAARAWADLETVESLQRLRELEQDPSPTVRAEVMQALARREGLAYLGSLTAALDGPSWPIRVAAVRAAVSLGPDAHPLIESALGNADGRVVVAAVAALGEIGDEDERIATFLGADDLALRGTAVELIAQTDHANKLEWLTSAYDLSGGYEWVEVRETILDAVGDEPQAESLLVRAAKGDPATSVRGRARRLLQRRGKDVASEAQPDSTPSPWLGAELPANPLAVLETTRGAIRIRCLPAAAPIHVASFLERVASGFYDGLGWHRVVPNFVIQGGDPRGDGWGTGEVFLRDEIGLQRFERGVVGMPKAGKDTGGCQIFITHIPTPHLEGNYTIYGVVEDGLDVVDRIEVGDRIERAYVIE
jgi:cyclophilin family peptidyl-prolyl cis-trans isomerase/HEAT repeat protein